MRMSKKLREYPKRANARRIRVYVKWPYGHAEYVTSGVRLQPAANEAWRRFPYAAAVEVEYVDAA